MKFPLLSLAACALAPTFALAAPALDLATEPLLGQRPVHPNVILDISVEFPTVGAAFRGKGNNNKVGNYFPAETYIGYFNPELCYTYNTAKQYFVSKRVANHHACGGSGEFSGNFMNWAGMSAIDTFRLTLTGGRRVVDTASTTVLERAWLPGGTDKENYGVPSFFNNSGMFPLRRVGSAVSPGQNQEGVANRVGISSVLPFASIDGKPITQATLVNCGDEILIGNGSGSGNCATPKTFGRFPDEATDVVHRYKMRVLVCDALDRNNGRSGDNGLCFQYPGGGWKPVGEIQRRADNMRFGAFGYLIHQNRDRYGGVLRHPLGHVGLRTYSATFGDAGANPYAEWDEYGVFHLNPRQISRTDAVIQSGLINYINNFGSLDGKKAAYKQYDPVSEMFYEVVRYLQWHRDGPTTKATAGLSESMLGGFPVYKEWRDDPLVCARQPNYIISISDENSHTDYEIPGNTRGNGSFDWPRAIDHAYALDIVALTNAAGREAIRRGGIGTSIPSDLAADTGVGNGSSNFIAGLAWYGRGDIRPDGARPGDRNAKGEQTFSTITINVMESGVANKRPLKIAGLVGSASGDRSNYMEANNPSRLQQLLRDAFTRVASATGSLGGGTIAAGSMVIDESQPSRVYVPYYDASGWAGELEAFGLSYNTATSTVSLDPAPLWRASSQLPAPERRALWLGMRGSHGVEFDWSELDASQRSALDTDPVSGRPDGLGERRLAYLRGSRDYESTDPESPLPFRQRSRSSLIGDIIGSAPVAVGPPQANLDLPGYAGFVLAHKSRRAMVYAGTNAGMIHGFDAHTGIERFAALPASVLDQLAALTNPGYRHLPLLDAPLVAGDARLSSGWASLLVGGYGAGLKGVFALDITDPDDFDEDSMLWEFTAADDSDMGHVTGKPIIAPIRVGEQTRWFMIVASGYGAHQLSAGAPASEANGDGRGALFFLRLDRRPGDSWRLGSNYFKITTPALPDMATGLSQPAAVFDQSGHVTDLYAGDLGGRVWNFDISGTTESRWKLGLNGQALLTATSASGARQAITAQPVIARGPSGGALVMVGTGKMIEVGDNAGPFAEPHSFYAVHNRDQRGYSRQNLALRQVRGSGNSTRIQGADFNYPDRAGWVLDLPDASGGEQSLSEGLLSEGTLRFNSTIPGADPCADGSAARYCLDALSGLESAVCSTPRSISSTGYLSAPILISVNRIDGEIGSQGRGQQTHQYVVIDFGSGVAADIGSGATVAISNLFEQSRSVRRMGWREIINWKELTR
ncbi:MAG: PilC/PilY family type IV pilus protein [Burkholderiaceae bacterium]